MKSDALTKLKSLVAAFEEAQAKHARQGAQDTEPDGMFQWLLVRAAKGKPARCDRGPDGWELYSDTPGVDEAAEDLGKAALACVEHVRSVPLGEAEEVLAFLRAYCWRVDW